MKKRRIISTVLALFLAVACVLPMINTASAAPSYGHSVYYRNNNCITDEWTATSYKGKTVPCRIITITPTNNSSLLHFFKGGLGAKSTTVGSAKAAQAFKLAYDSAAIACTALSVASVINDAYQLLGKSSSINNSQDVSFVHAVRARKKVVLVYIYYSGKYWLSHYGESLDIEWQITTDTEFGLKNVTRKFTVGAGNLNYNLSTCCQNTLDLGCKMNWKSINNLKLTTFGKTVSYYFASPDAFSRLGAKAFAPGQAG